MGKRPFYRKVRQTLHETVSDSGKSILCYRGNNDKIYYVASSNDPNVGPGGGMIEVTWQELKNKRDAGELISGSLYRITDYQCTTTQENTKSAGHQFDIVLLALSENKLAEEGWAMEHPTDVYDVTFVDGITKKCYLYEYNTNDGEWNIVDVDTLIGITGKYAGEGEDIVINENNKTATCADSSTDLTEENLPCNYFQNSNLSAWKVWYCLDNDKSRFAWAMDGTGVIILWGEEFIRKKEGDVPTYNLAAWYNEDKGYIYTKNENPQKGDTIYGSEGEESESDVVEGIIIGRGVIYRLIDEWNNDVPYDFKNIQFVYNGDIMYAFFDNTDFSDYSLSGYVKDNRCFLSVEEPFMPYYNNGRGQRCVSNIFLGAFIKNIVTGDTSCNIYKLGNLITQ